MGFVEPVVDVRFLNQNLNSFYQIKGRSGKDGILIIGGRTTGLERYAKRLARYF